MKFSFVLFFTALLFLNTSDILGQSFKLGGAPMSDKQRTSMLKMAKRDIENLGKRGIGLEKILITLERVVGRVTTLRSKTQGALTLLRKKVEDLAEKEKEMVKKTGVTTMFMSKRKDSLFLWELEAVSILLEQGIGEIEKTEGFMGELTAFIDEQTQSLKTTKEALDENVTASNFERRLQSYHKRMLALENLSKLKDSEVAAMLLLKDFQMLGQEADILQLDLRSLENALKQKIRDSALGRYIEEWSARMLQESCNSAQMCAKGGSVQDMNRNIRDVIRKLKSSVFEKGDILGDQ